MSERDREALLQIYKMTGDLFHKIKRRPDTSGHVCDYRNALHGVKDIAKRALSQSGEPERPICEECGEECGARPGLAKLWPLMTRARTKKRTGGDGPGRRKALNLRMGGP